jgi:hypothetical protein
MDRVNQKLANGEPLKDVFDMVEVFIEDYAVVVLNGRYNFIDKNNNFISNKWFDDARSFNEGYAVVGMKGNYNFINKNGKLLSDEWFYDAGSFKNGYALVCKDDGEYDEDFMNYLYNYINGDGEYLFKEWLTYLHQTKDTNYIKIGIELKLNLMNDKYKLLSDELSDEWFFDITVKDIEKGYVVVSSFNDWNTYKTINLKEINF